MYCFAQQNRARSGIHRCSVSSDPAKRQALLMSQSHHNLRSNVARGTLCLHMTDFDCAIVVFEDSCKSVHLSPTHCSQRGLLGNVEHSGEIHNDVVREDFCCTWADAK